MEALLIFWAVVWICKNAAEDIMYAVRGRPSPRRVRQLQRIEASGGTPGYGLSGFARDFADDFLRERTAKRRDLAEKKRQPDQPRPVEVPQAEPAGPDTFTPQAEDRHVDPLGLLDGSRPPKVGQVHYEEGTNARYRWDGATWWKTHNADGSEIPPCPACGRYRYKAVGDGCGNCQPITAASQGGTSRPSPADLRFDGRPGAGTDPADYARYLDQTRPGWWEADEGHMSKSLADLARHRRVSPPPGPDARPLTTDLGFDGHPTLDMSDPDATAAYARRLDAERPGWWEADERGMDFDLAQEAYRRRDADPTSAGPDGPNGLGGAGPADPQEDHQQPPSTTSDATVIPIFGTPNHPNQQEAAMTTEVTGLTTAINYAEGAAATHETFAADAEGFAASLAANGVGDGTVGLVTQAAEASNNAASAWSAVKAELEAQTNVKEAYDATPDAGDKAFVTSE